MAKLIIVKVEEYVSCLLFKIKNFYFQKTTKSVKELEKLKKKHGTVTPKPISPKKVSSQSFFKPA